MFHKEFYRSIFRLRVDSKSHYIKKNGILEIKNIENIQVMGIADIKSRILDQALVKY